MYPDGEILFLTWRLFGPIATRMKSPGGPGAGRAFVDADRALDCSATGPFWLADSRVAQIAAEAIERGANKYRLYDLYAWVIMPNHVHCLIKPAANLPRIMRWLKGSTARAANLLLGRTGQPFWQYETYDHVVRNSDELNRIISYIERNPVKAGLISSPEQWRWSSANARRRPALTSWNESGL